MGAFAPVMGGEQVTDATAYSLVLQVPLAGECCWLALDAF